MKYQVELDKGYIEFPLRIFPWMGIHKLFKIMKEPFPQNSSIEPLNKQES